MANILPTTMEYFDKLLGEQLLEGEGGGGGETWQTVFEGSVTTQASGDNARAIVQGYDLSADTIKVTFNGTEYVCEFNETTGYGAGDNGSGDLDWSEYPFNIFPRGGALIITTETAGTYTLKIEEEQSGGGLETAEVTFICSAGDYAISHCSIENGNLIAGIMDRICDDEPLTIMIPLLNGQAILDQSAFYDIEAGVPPTTTGSIELGQGGIIITGDGTITAKGLA